MIVNNNFTEEKCLIKNGSGRLENGVILDRRMNDSGILDLYVHYVGKDRRFDEWVCSENIKILKQSKKKKVTNSLKPKRTPQTKRQSLCDSEDYLVVVDKEYEEYTKVKLIETVRFGNYELDTWYFSPLPDDYGRQKYLYICDMCMIYIKSERSFRVHLNECENKTPPGREIYREDNLAIYEVSGQDQKLYCQCLCLFSKLFINDKTIYYDTSCFSFFVLCEIDNEYARPVGYFSKENGSPEGRNLSCLLVFPPFQRKGYGKLLIQLSYELSKREKIIGTPEKPLSDLGYCSYRSYWAFLVVDYLKRMMDKSFCTLKVLASEIEIAEEDVLEALQYLQLAENPDDPIRVSFKQLNCLYKTVARPPLLILSTRLVRWKPSIKNKS